MSFGVTETNSDLGWRFWTLITLRMKWLIHFLVWKISSTELNSCCFLLLDNCNILTVWQKSAKIRRCKAPVRVQTISHMCAYTDIHTDMKSPKSQAYTASLCLNHSLGVLSQTRYYETTTKENWRPKLKKVGETMRPFRYGLNQIPYDYTVEVMNRFKGLDLIERLKNYGQRFMTLYKRQWSRSLPRKRNAKRLSEEALQIAVKKETPKANEEREDIPIWMQSSKK